MDLMLPIPVCGKHGTRLMLRRIGDSDEGDLACPYCDMEELGGGEQERNLIDDVLREKSAPPN